MTVPTVSYEKEASKPKEYEDFTDKHTGSPPNIIIEEPAFINHCSHEALAIIFRKLGTYTGIKRYGTGQREWLVVFCDGLPFSLGIHVQVGPRVSVTFTSTRTWPH